MNPQELVSEKWNPILGVKEIVLSVISMLCSPNIESPANIEAALMYRDNKTQWENHVRKLKDSMYE